MDTRRDSQLAAKIPDDIQDLVYGSKCSTNNPLTDPRSLCASFMLVLRLAVRETQQ